MRQVVIAGSAARRIEAAAAGIPTGRELRIVARSRRAADHLVHTLARAGRGFGLRRHTLLGLATDLAAVALGREGRTPTGGLGLEALAARTILAQRGALTHFAPIAGTPGFPRALARTLARLRLDGVTAERLEARPGRGPRELARLLLAFERELERADDPKIDAAGIYERATAELQAGRGGRLPLVLLDVAPETRRERQFLVALAEASESVLAVESPELATSVGELLAAEPTTLPEAESSSLARARRHLFAVDPPPAQPLDASLELFSASTEAAECIEIARRVLAAASQGLLFDRIAVLLRAPGAYQPLLEDAFERAKIPLHATRGTRRPNPAGRAFLAVLACAEEGLSADRFAEYLSLGQVPITDENGGAGEAEAAWVESKDETQLAFRTPSTPPRPAADPEALRRARSLVVPRHWERLLVDAAVIGGRDRWHRRLTGLRRELELSVKDATKDGEEAEGQRRELVRLANLEAFALPLVDRLAALPARATWDEWLPELERLAELVLVDAAPVLGVLAELRPLGKLGPVGLGEVRATLTERLALLRDEPTSRGHGKVLVASLGEVASLPMDLVFLPGLAEGIFPERPREDPLLLDEDRIALGLPALGPEGLLREHQLLFAALGSATERLVLSYPRTQLDHGRPRVPSLYAVELLRAAEGRVASPEELDRRSRSATELALGWPAPASPSEAIDEAEYDLAHLQAVLRAGGDASGQAAYLLEASAPLARSLRRTWRRARPSWSSFDGLVKVEDATRTLLAAHAPDRRSYSASALEKLAGCPFAFYLNTVARLRPREVPVRLEALDPRTRGSLAHLVLARFVFGLAADGRLGPGWATGDDLAQRLERLVDDVGREQAELLAPALPWVFAKELADIRSDLLGWLRREATSTDGFVPAHAELAFGLADDDAERDPASSDEPVTIFGRYLVRGSIDLVERHPERGQLRVTDHKTGGVRTPKPKIIGGGSTLQPLLYALAAEARLGLPVEVGRLYFSTRRGSYTKIDIAASPSHRATLEGVFQLLERAVGAGWFPAAPREPNTCKYCDYSPVCGPKAAEHAAAKDASELAELMALRSTP